MKIYKLKIIFVIFNIYYTSGLFAQEENKNVILHQVFPNIGSLLLVQQKTNEIPQINDHETAEKTEKNQNIIFFWKKTTDESIEIHKEYNSLRAKSIQTGNKSPIPWGIDDSEREAKSLANFNAQIESNTLVVPTVLAAELINGTLYVVYWNSLRTKILSYKISEGEGIKASVFEIFRDEFASNRFVKKASIRTAEPTYPDQMIVEISLSDESSMFFGFDSIAQSIIMLDISE